MPDHLLGEILTKRWMDNAIPLLILLLVAFALGAGDPEFLRAGRASPTLMRQWGEFGFIVLALTIVMIVGGIDLSRRLDLRAGNIVALYLLHVLKWPVAPAVVGHARVRRRVGLVNGVLIGYLRLRAFLTTLVTLIIVRAIVDLLLPSTPTAIAGGLPDSEVWYFIGEGDLLGVPFSVVVTPSVAIFGHILLTRMRAGWHVTRDRRLAPLGAQCRHPGAPRSRSATSRSGMLTALAGIFFASRLATAGADIGVGLEITALTAAVLGGNSLGGGSGSAMKAMIGTLIVLLIINGLSTPVAARRLQPHAAAGIVLLAAVIDVRWLKNRHKILSQGLCRPTYHGMPPLPSTAADSGTAYALNDRLRPATPIGLGRDRRPGGRDPRRRRQHLRRQPPRRHRPLPRARLRAAGGLRPYRRHAARHGLRPRRHRCFAASAAWASTGSRPIARSRRLTDETNRSWFSIIDDSRLRLADDLDITDDGRVFFSRGDDPLRDARVADRLPGIARQRPDHLLRHRTPARRAPSPRTSIFPNGICIAMTASRSCSPRPGAAASAATGSTARRRARSRPSSTDLPGYPDNINRASDGTYWLALVGMRTPSLDLALKMPGFRKRMARRIAPRRVDVPEHQHRLRVRTSTRRARSSRRCGISAAQNHPMITSMREHKGHLYIGGILNNRIGRLKLDGADPDFDPVRPALGEGAHDRRARSNGRTICSAAARQRSPCRRSTAR